MNVRFQADADLNQILVKATSRREPTIDFKTATAAQFEGLSDLEVLKRSANDNRILVSHDHRTMPRHFARFIDSNQSSGVIVVPQKLPVRTVVEELLLIWTVTEAAEWVNRIVFLPL